MKSKLLLTSFLICNFCIAQNNLQKISATTGAACYRIEYANGYLYAGAGNTLMVFDTAGNPPYQKLFEHRFISNITDIKIRANRMYVAANHDGLALFDITAPASPVLLNQYVPDSLTEAAYKIALYGDTVFVAYKTKMAVFFDNTSLNTLSLLNTFARQSGESIIRGCAVKNNLLAYTTGYGTNAQTGVHIVQLPSHTELNFFEQDFADPEDVVFGQNTNLLHVLGGTESWLSNGSDPRGIFYSLNISNPSSPSLAYSDTLKGVFYFYVAQPTSAEIVNDTIYIATNAAPDTNASTVDTAAYVYVYDVHDTANIHFIKNIYAGLWHFDVAVNNKKLYIASEWYGIKTIDITNIFSPVDLGKTLTGGWNTSSDKFGNHLAVCNEGYGFKQFDISDMEHPVLSGVNNDGGFNYGISYDKTGNYIFGYYYTGDDFRVFNSSTLLQVASVDVNALACDFLKTILWNDKSIVIEQPTFSAPKILVMDVANPLAPAIDTVLAINNILDIEVNSAGKLFVSTLGYLYVFDMANNFVALDTMSVILFQQFKVMAVYNDTVYINSAGLNGGLKKYSWNGNQLTQVGATFTLPFDDLKYLAADTFGLYLDYQREGLYAADKSTLTQTGYYKTGLEFYRADQWGQKALRCKDNLILLVEYFGQTTILSNDNNLHLSVNEISFSEKENRIHVYPNPSSGKIFVDARNLFGKEKEFLLTDVLGNTIQSINVTRKIISLDVSFLSDGVYFITANGVSEKIVVGH